jgi:DNA-binding CsgD family transcriptional regulator
VSEDSAWRALWRGFAPGERARLGEEFFYRAFRTSLGAMAILSLIAIPLSSTNTRSGWIGTFAIAAPVGVAAGLVCWRYPERGYAFFRAHRLLPLAAGPTLALLALWSATDPNALYFPAMAIMGVSVAVAQRRREIAAAAISLAAGALASAFVSSSTSPELQAHGEFALSALGVLVVGQLLAMLVEVLARGVMTESSRASENPDSRELPLPLSLARTAPDPGSPERARINELLRAVGERAILRRDGYSAREVQVFFLLYGGLTAKEAAGYLGVAPNVVYKQIDRCRKRKDKGVHDIIHDLHQRGYLESLAGVQATLDETST